MGRKRSYSSKQRKSHMNSLLRRFDHRCWWCKCPVVRAPTGFMDAHPPNRATRDHLQLHSQRGKYLATNLVLACWSCNQRRDDMTVAEWVNQLRCEGLDHDWEAIPPVEFGHPEHVRIGHARKSKRERTRDADPVPGAVLCNSADQLGGSG